MKKEDMERIEKLAKSFSEILDSISNTGERIEKETGKELSELSKLSIGELKSIFKGTSFEKAFDDFSKYKEDKTEERKTSTVETTEDDFDKKSKLSNTVITIFAIDDEDGDMIGCGLKAKGKTGDLDYLLAKGIENFLKQSISDSGKRKEMLDHIYSDVKEKI